MPHRTATKCRGWSRRLLSLLLAAVLTAGLVPGLTLPASAHWADKYLDQLVDWGIMRADQTGDPDAPLTRADFMAIINRAYGYTKTGPIPFTDVSRSDWFYDDVAIAYNAGYMAGTSATTAHPNLQLTREMAVCILARNLMMESTPGENLAFSDARDVSSWARGLVKTAVDNYIVSGYPDNSFGPQDPVSKGQMATLIVQCIGTPLSKAGDYSLGDVFGNVTITDSGVTLRNTTISGDLYVSGGVGLGDVKLENVNVLGRIIVSGTGESQQGDASVVLRNVTANSMLVDNMKNQLVTLRAEGLTNIAQTTVRTNAYLEDNTPDDYGLRKINMEETGGKLDLAGRIKEVVNTAPRSTIQLAKGTLATLTVDEDAVSSTVQVDRNTEIKDLNLDTGTAVNGQGDVDKMNINASGVTTTMLPDDLYIRPGLTASVAGDTMDSAAAEESSLDPRILAGYPLASDVAPTSLKAEFAANKKGTIYWAVSNITDGSITADDLISPPSYASLALKNGSVATPSADTVVPVQITGLTVGGSYYLSAVLVDGRGERSPVKVISFTTPDNTKPAFAQGYPYMSLITDTMAQATVMATKSCKLYYAVLPQGAQAPSVNDLKSASVTGNLGYGVMDVIKNTEHTFTVSRQLEELKNYVVYFWLTDADGVNSSNIVSLRFTTVDKTPPEFDPDPNPNNATVAATSVSLPAGLNEAGTIFWAIVPEGKPYPLPNNQNRDDNILDEEGNSVSARLDSEYAKLQVVNGRNATKSGSVAVRDGNTDVTLNITGLARETSYDLYYVARDTAGNYSLTVKRITIHTMDSTGPVVRQYFNNFQGDDETKNPMSNSDFILQFNENILIGNNQDVLTLYEVATGKRAEDPDNNLTMDNAKAFLYNALSNHFVLYQVNTATNVSTRVPVWDSNDSAIAPTGNWINYRNVVVRSAENGSGIEIVFQGESGDGQAVSLSSGSRYYFELTAITDSSGNTTIPTTLNPKNCVGTDHVLDYFDTVFALVDLAPGDGVSTAPDWVQNPDVNNAPGKGEGNKARVDTTFTVTPRSTQNADPDIRYELIILTDSAIDYDLYYRIIDTSKNDKIPVTDGEGAAYRLPENRAVDNDGWVYLGNKRSTISEGLAWDSGTVVHDFLGITTAGSFPYLQSLSEDYTYEFAISVTGKDASSEYEEWSGQVNFRAYVVASNGNAVRNFVHAGNVTPEKITAWDTGVGVDSGRSIGTYGTSDYVTVRAIFIDTMVPTFTTGPEIVAGDVFADITIALTRPATIYYVIAPRRNVIDTEIYVPRTSTTSIIKAFDDSFNANGTPNIHEFWDVIEKQTNSTSPGTLTEYKVLENKPSAQNLSNPSRYYPTYAYGTFEYISGGTQVPIHIGPQADGNTLVPLTDYYIYMVVKGTSAKLSEVYVYNFSTSETSKPKITMSNEGNGVAGAATEGVTANLNYVLFTTTELNKIPMLAAEKKSTSTDNLMSEYVATGLTLPTRYSDYTVIQAMKEPYKAGNDNGDMDSSAYDGYSVFDVYASETAKTQVANIIRNTSTGTALVRGRDTTTGALVPPTYIDHSKDMEMGTYYWCLAVAYNTSSVQGTGDTFAAIDNIMIPDTVAPNLDANNGLGYSVISNENQNAPTINDTFKGTLELTFDKPVYWTRSSGGTGSALPVVAQNVTGAITDSSTYVGILQDMGGTSMVTGKGLSIGKTSTSPNAQSTFTLSFTNLSIGDTIMLFNEGYIANASGYSATRKLRLTLTWGKLPSQSGINREGAYFVATWING